MEGVSSAVETRIDVSPAWTPEERREVFALLNADINALYAEIEDMSDRRDLRAAASMRDNSARIARLSQLTTMLMDWSSEALEKNRALFQGFII